MTSLILAAQSYLHATELYVSPDGSGTSFTLEHPGNLFEAQDYVRTISSNMTSDIVVTLLGGTYQLTNSFQLQENAAIHDSGQNGYNIVYKNDPGQTPVISGGFVVTNWTLFDPAKNIWRAHVGLGVNSRQLYVNGVRAIRARSEIWPETTGTDMPGFGRTPSGYWTTTTAMQNWRNPSNIEVVTRWHWEQRRCPVASINGTNIVMQEPCWNVMTTSKKGKMYGPSWIENAYELMISPGMWYLDQAAGWLYYIPRQGENLTKGAVVVLPVVEKLIDAEGGDFMTFKLPIHNIVLSGLTFEYATWLLPSAFGYPGFGCGTFFLVPTNGTKVEAKTLGNVSFQEAANIVITNCVFTHLGGSGVDFTYARNCSIIGNYFDDISGDGISLGELENQLVPYQDKLLNNVIQNNCIRRVGQDYENDVGIFLAQPHDSLVAHNDVDNTPYSGLVSSKYGSGNQVVANYFGRTMQTLYDGADTYYPKNQRISLTVGNYMKGGLDHGIYFDEYSEGHICISNVLDNIKSDREIFWHLAGEHLATNNWVYNTFINGTTKIDAPPGCLTNTVYVKDGFWPLAAQQIILNAGLEPEFTGIKPEFMVNDADAVFDQVPPSWKYVERKRTARLGEYGGDVHYCTQAGDTLQYTFTATGIAWIGDLDIDSSTNVAVYLDGQFQRNVNCWSSSLVTQFRLFSATNLSPGLHTLKLVNVRGGKTVVDAFAVTPANFWLTATPISGSVAPGVTFSNMIKLDTYGGYTGTTTLSASGLPAGAVASFNPTSFTGAGFSTLTIALAANTPAGTTRMIVAGVGGGVTNIATVALTIKPKHQ